MTSRSIAELAESLRSARSRGTGATLLVGAGCSRSSGIPSAFELVQRIQATYPMAYGRAVDKQYQSCMEQLTADERRALINDYVRDAKINWEHICIALLMQNGFADRVLTTNFDLLIPKACAFLGHFPAIYDAAATKTFRVDALARDSVIFLNGQIDGFIQLNTPVEFREHSDHHVAILQNSNQARTWLIVGYSGENDRTFGDLSEIPTFPGGIYWALREHRIAPTTDAILDRQVPHPGRMETLVPDHVKRFLEARQNAYVTTAHDAEELLVELCRELGVFPPEFLVKPFSFLQSQLARLVPFTLPRTQVQTDFLSRTKELVSEATSRYEASELPPGVPPDKESTGIDIDSVQQLLMAGRVDEVISKLSEPGLPLSPHATNLLYLAYLDRGVRAALEAEKKPIADRSALLAESEAFFRSALALDDSTAAAAMDLANVLVNRASFEASELAHARFREADQLYERASELEPADADLLVNWGNGLGAEASRLNLNERPALYRRALAVLTQATELDPKNDRSWTGLGEVLRFMANDADPANARALLSEAGEKFGTALALRPSNIEALNNWGSALQKHAYLSFGDEQLALLWKAVETFRRVVALDPNHLSGLVNLGLALFDLLRIAPKEFTSVLLNEAETAYKSALALPEDDRRSRAEIYGDLILLYATWMEHSSEDYAEYVEKTQRVTAAALTLDNRTPDLLHAIGYTYWIRAKKVGPVESATFYREAELYWQKALEMDPKHTRSELNLASALIERARREESWEELLSAALATIKAVLAREPNDLTAQSALAVATSMYAERVRGTSSYLERVRDAVAAQRVMTVWFKDDPQYWNNLAGQLIHNANADPAVRSELLSEARHCCEKAETLLNGSGAYNLACISAREGNTIEARRLLEVLGRTSALPTAQHMASDDDLAAFRGLPWFEALLAARSAATGPTTPQ